MQAQLEKIDRLVKSRILVDLEGMLDHDCKIVEMYYNPDLKRKLNCFHNGILIYHKNRLITRYKYKFGELIDLTFNEKIL